MNTNALRQKILDLAIHGKLVKQDPADESATILLEKIRAEKEKKIASGELKRGKNDSYIFFGDDNRHYEKFADGRIKDIEDEIPFAVPEGWAWCRLGEVCEFKGGGTPDKLDLSYWGGNLNWASVKDIKGKFLYSTEDKITELGLKNSAANLAKIDDIILITRILPGKAIITKIETAINQDLKIVLPKIEIEKQFLLYFFKYVENDFVEKSNGTTVKGIKLECLTSTPFPLPPLAEQKRIVTAIEAILAQIDLLEQNKVDLQTAVKQAKSKILDLAIRGKLVPQNPADEPASVMLEKLRAEKEAKIAAGEIKRGKNDSYIYKNSTDNCYYEKFFGKNDVCIDNEIPFELPAKWQWCRLGEVCDYGKCENIEVSKLKPDDWILDLEDIEKDSGKIITFHSFAERRSESTKHIFRKGDLLYSKLRPYLNKVVIAPKDGFCTSEILPLNFNGVLLNEFAQRLLMSFFFLSTVNMLVYGVKMPRLGRDDAKKIFIPIPPISEQKRIVTRIEEIFYVLDNIQSNLV
ncbi:restriction endonuclease subunit S [Treponema denticola]|nr:restriction endonuclease subunit S [Treponema denticola]EPF36493.1 hypothetical protein HMPREF9732_01606 [Treponema denticola SP32]